MEQFSQMIATALKLPVHRVENTLKLLQGGATIPFISRYRKEATGGFDEVQIGDIHTKGNRTFYHRRTRKTDRHFTRTYFQLLGCDRTGRYLPAF